MRLEEIASAFLRYLYEENHFRPEVAGFLTSTHAEEIHPPVSRHEFEQVLRGLRSRELISVPRDDDADRPKRAGLTGSGLICVDHYGGDVVAWARSQNAPVAVLDEDATGEEHRNSSPGPDGQPVPVMVPARQTRESSGETREDLFGLTRVARVVLLALPTVHAGRGETEHIERTARDLLDATQQPRPDRKQVRLLAYELRNDLSGGSVASTLGVVLLDSLDEALEESRLG